jgi:hypothetical protein
MAFLPSRFLYVNMKLAIIAPVKPVQLKDSSVMDAAETPAEIEGKAGDPQLSFALSGECNDDNKIMQHRLASQFQSR